MYIEVKEQMWLEVRYTNMGENACTSRCAKLNAYLYVCVFMGVCACVHEKRGSST